MSTTSTVKTVHVEKNTKADIIRSVRIFFGLKISNPYKKSRIIRKPTKSYEEFIFKGYDQQRPGLSKSGSFKNLKLIGKN